MGVVTLGRPQCCIDKAKVGHFMPSLRPFIDRLCLTGGGHNGLFEGARAYDGRANDRIMV